MSRFGTHDALLSEWRDRPRTLPRDVASHPITLRRVMDDLDATGRSEAGDCIQSLVFELQIARNRAERIAGELMSIDAREPAHLRALLSRALVAIDNRADAACVKADIRRVLE